MLELKNISFSAKTENGSAEILKNVDLTIPTGKFIVITGPNGGGKSTMAKIIMGIERPTEGKILLDGQDITDLDVTVTSREDNPAVHLVAGYKPSSKEWNALCGGSTGSGRVNGVEASISFE